MYNCCSNYQLRLLHCHRKMVVLIVGLSHTVVAHQRQHLRSPYTHGSLES